MATILIVDDRPTNRDFLVTLLRYRQHRLLEATDGLEALRLARAEHPDLIISDILMPTMDGYEFVRQLRADPSISHIPAVFSTAHYLGHEAMALAKACGVAFIINKPCEPEAVLRTIDSVLSSPTVPALPPKISEFDSKHLRLLTDKVATQANALHAVNQKLTALLELGNHLASERDPLRLLDKYCRAARGIIGTQYAIVGIVRDQEATLEHVFTGGMDDATTAHLGSISPYQGVLGTLLKEKRPCRLSDLHSDPQTGDLPSGFPPLRSFLGVPISFQARVYGWLCLLNKLGANAFEEADEQLAVTLASQVAVAYENARLYQDIEQHARALEQEMMERQRAEVELQRHATWFSQLFENAPVGTVAVDAHGRVLRVNKSFEILFQWSQDNIYGRLSDDVIVPPELKEESHWLFRSTLQGVAVAKETTRQRQDGSRMPVQIYTVPVMVNGECVGGYAMYVDLSEHKRLEAQFLQAQKMEAIGTLAGGIAHDFNNILGVIFGYIELALDDLPSASQAWRHLEQVLSAGMRAKNLVQQILTFSRQGEQEPKPVQLVPLIKEVLAFLRVTLPTTIEIRHVLHEETGTVLANPTQMHQILMNLCTNAAYAMRESGGVLSVGLAAYEVTATAAGHSGLTPGPYLRLTVHDTGHGIAPEIRECIFEPFFTTKEVGEGTGMGLAVVHGIVTKCGGTVAVESAPGHGATFTVSLPCSNHTAPAPVDPEEAVPLGTERILFVDDESALAQLGQQLLSRLGYEVVSLSSGAEALETFRAQPDRFDLVITDQTMPHMTGDVLACEMRRLRPNIPIILCTGFSQMLTAEKVEALGIDALCMKPLVARDLARTIRQVLTQRTTKES